MSTVLKRPTWLSINFHENITDKKHRDNCPSCGTAYTAIEVYLDLINESEAKAN